MNLPKPSWLTFACLCAAMFCRADHERDWLMTALLLACAVLSLRWTGRLGKDEDNENQ